MLKEKVDDDSSAGLQSNKDDFEQSHHPSISKATASTSLCLYVIPTCLLLACFLGNIKLVVCLLFLTVGLMVPILLPDELRMPTAAHHDDESGLIESVNLEIESQSVLLDADSMIYRLRGHEYRLLDCLFPSEPGVNTLGRLFARSARLFADLPLLGTRKACSDGQLGPYKWQTYSEVATAASCLADGMKSTCPWLRNGSRVGVFSKNTAEITTTFISCWQEGFVIVPIYDTLGHGAIEYIVQHAEISVILVSLENLLKLQNAAVNLPQLKTVIVYPQHFPLVRSHTRSNYAENLAAAERKFIDYEEVVVSRTSSTFSSSALPEPESLAFILYTSGTTDTPKGVMLSHKSFLAGAAGLLSTVNVSDSDVHISYLPLAHAFEVLVQIAGISVGACTGFYHGNVKELIEDVAELKPTIFIGVPRVYQRIHQVVLQKLAAKFSIVRRVAYYAIQQQAKRLRAGKGRSVLWDILVFKQVQSALGGRVRLMCTGSAPLSVEIQEFLKVCFGVPVVEGYGMTENSAASHAMIASKAKQGEPAHVGPPLACCEMKLESVPELQYTTTDRPCPRGEILVRGPMLFKGYYKRPDLTAEVLTQDGWLRTGDIGCVNGDGTLSVIDRRKNIFKLSQGEYVAPEKLEGVFMSSRFVGQCFVYGDSYQNSLVAVVVPDPLELLPFLKSSGDWPDSPTLTKDLSSWIPQFADLCHTSRLREFILEEMEQIAKTAHLRRFEWVKAVWVEGQVNGLMQGFSVENDCLTPTFKIKRRQILARYQQRIDEMYQFIG